MSPYKAKLPCPDPRCPRLGCRIHVRAHDQRFYDSAAWRAMRAAQLQREPRCAVCGGRATVADHIVSRSQGGNDQQLQSLCRRDHNVKTARSSAGMRGLS